MQLASSGPRTTQPSPRVRKPPHVGSLQLPTEKPNRMTFFFLAAEEGGHAQWCRPVLGGPVGWRASWMLGKAKLPQHSQHYWN